MATPTASPRLKAQVLYTLKEYGDIDTDPGRASAELLRALQAKGVSPSGSGVRTARRELEDEGLIECDIPAGGSQINRIRLASTGDYVDPWTPEGEAVYSVNRRGQRTGIVGASKGGGSTKLENAMRIINSLPMSERMMVIGSIADQAATEYEEREAKLKAAFASI